MLCKYGFTFIIVLDLFCRRNGTEHEQKGGRILILGAGISGITAAKTLHEAGHQNFRIIEASGRLGGRIHEATLGSHTVELGAMWIYGKGSNPLYDLAMKYNISLVGSAVDDWTVRDENGYDVTDNANVALANITNVLKQFNAHGTHSKVTRSPDFNVQSGLRHFEWRPKSPVDDVVETFVLDFEVGAGPDVLSGSNLNMNETYEDFGNFEMLAVKDPQGFASIVRKLHDDILDQDDFRVEYDKTVVSIDQSGSDVTVLTADGESYTADYAIVTFSLGVLQERKVRFTPELSKSKMLAIDKFAINKYTHIYVRYQGAFWDDTLFILFASKLRGRFSCWLNMNSIYPESNILQLSLFGQDSTWADRSTDRDILAEMQRTLKTMYPNITIPEPLDFKISRWNTDPLFMGAFSYWPATFTEQDMTSLRKPEGRIFFSGEHLHSLHYGFAHGAYIVAQSVARDVMECVKNGHAECTCSFDLDLDTQDHCHKQQCNATKHCFLNYKYHYLYDVHLTFWCMGVVIVTMVSTSVLHLSGASDSIIAVY
ncbi:uncharacterized protein LOC128227614 [Mya arenaria]|uniref:uncharacterized protein LOC128227614 n=1 Tax=Mya arenaria TaxID=6604 RepID=UPI0022E19A34|nr:uncharacterized protein LOC128227614 [Mya arenaria]